MAKPVTKSLESLKAELQDRKLRVEALNRQREALLKEATIQEQNGERALKELAELGYPQAAGLDRSALAALTTQLLTECDASLTILTRDVEAGEAAMAGPVVDPDLE